MKFGTQNKLNMLTINILLVNILNAKFGPKAEMCSNFYEIWHLQHIEHANYEYLPVSRALS